MMRSARKTSPAIAFMSRGQELPPEGRGETNAMLDFKICKRSAVSFQRSAKLKATRASRADELRRKLAASAPHTGLADG